MNDDVNYNDVGNIMSQSPRAFVGNIHNDNDFDSIEKEANTHVAHDTFNECQEESSATVDDDNNTQDNKQSTVFNIKNTNIPSTKPSERDGSEDFFSAMEAAFDHNAAHVPKEREQDSNVVVKQICEGRLLTCVKDLASRRKLDTGSHLGGGPGQQGQQRRRRGGGGAFANTNGKSSADHDEGEDETVSEFDEVLADETWEKLKVRNKEEEIIEREMEPAPIRDLKEVSMKTWQSTKEMSQNIDRDELMQKTKQAVQSTRSALSTAFVGVRHQISSRLNRQPSGQGGPVSSKTALEICPPPPLAQGTKN